MLAARTNMGRLNLAGFMIQQTEHDFFPYWATTLNYSSALAGVHVASFAADEGLIRLDRASELVGCRHAERYANSMIHEPCGFLRDADGPVDFVRTHAVLAVHNLPHRHEPLVQAQGGIFEDRPGFRGKLPEGVIDAALPAVVLVLEQNLDATAPWAGDAVWPAMRHKVLSAIVRAGEVEDRFLECVRFHA